MLTKDSHYDDMFHRLFVKKRFLESFLNIFHAVSDPRSAPVSPSLQRKLSNHAEPDISAPGTPTLRSGSGGRRKLGSRHGWGIGLARGGSGVSQSFSPGDQKTHPRQRLRSSQTSQTSQSSVLWEGAGAEMSRHQDPESPLTSQDGVEEDDGRGGEKEQ